MLGRLIAASSIAGDDTRAGVPFSHTEESDTRALLYGSHFAQDAKLDFNKDLRMSILCDHPACDSMIFDSAAFQFGPSYQSNSIQRLSDGLIKSISSMSFTTSHATPPLDNDLSNGMFKSRNSRNIGETNPSASSLYMQHYDGLPEVLPISLLKQLAFGYTPLKFDKSITKLHVLPVINDKSGQHSTWLISQIFKIKLPVSDYSRARNSKMMNNFHTSSVRRLSESSQLQNETEDSWDPQSVYLKHSTMKSTGIISKSNDLFEEIRCALCIYIKVPSDSPNMVINHWEEILQALLEAEIHVSRRIFCLLQDLPDNYKQTTHSRNSFSMADDNLFISYSEKFRIRIASGLHIPRVLCGQDQWLDIFKQIKCISKAFDTTDTAAEFLASVIANFIVLNKKLIKGTLEYGLEPSTRTILISNHAASARKLLFLLSSLIHGKYANVQNVECQNDGKSLGLAGVLRSISSTTSLSTESISSMRVIEDRKGWDIASSGKAPIVQQELAVPCMVRPGTSPIQSLSKSLMRSNSSSRFSLDTFYRSMTSNASVFSHRLSESSSVTVFDDDFEFTSGDSYNERNERENSYFKQPFLFDSIGSGSADSPLQTIGTPLYTMHNVQPAVLDVHIDFDSVTIENDMNSNSISSPIAGHISEFHPEFLVQAVPFYKELEEKITQAMFNDGQIWGNNSTQSRIDNKLEDKVISSTLIVHLGRKELYQWAIIETATETSNMEVEYRQKIVKKKIYPNKRGFQDTFSKKCREMTEKLEKMMKASTLHPTNEQINELKSEYLSCFGV